MSIWTSKIVPVSDVQASWSSEPVGGAHWSKVDETEEDLDLSNYIYTNVDGQLDDLTLGNAGIPGAAIIECIDISVHLRSQDVIFHHLAWLYFGDEWHFCGFILQPHEESGPFPWQWRTITHEEHTSLSSGAFDGCMIRLEGGAPLRLDIAAVYVRVKHSPLGLASSHNIFGQRFRAFDDGAAGDVSFERRDLPAGDWSVPIQPFAGGGNSRPAIQCLPDGRLRAAYINADGNVVKAQSRDDGESWEVV